MIEQQRLAELHRYDILDTAPEEPYDAIVRVAAGFFNAPIAAISLIDLDRQWYKARIGTDLIETPRCLSFCDHVVRTQAMLIVDDARADARFCENPHVRGAPWVRFYAGAPLRMSAGGCIGAICIAAPEPRAFDTAIAADFLDALARRTVDLVERRADRERDLYAWPAVA